MKTYAGWYPGSRDIAVDLLRTMPIHTGEWQAMDTSRSPVHATHEIQDVTFAMAVPFGINRLQDTVQPDLPWAEDHFLERVSGVPHNPPPSASRWPYAVRGNGDHTNTQGQFDHTYPERFWPKRANTRCPTPEECMSRCPGDGRGHHDSRGIRFAYGDLSDVVRLLVRSPYTRQAYLPVWFPEDTGASARKGDYDPSRVRPIRVPCTLGYHFMYRDGELSCRYYIRSCDMRRHFTNDVYLACRLTQWMADRMHEGLYVSKGLQVEPGVLIMHITSLHCFVGDVAEVAYRFGRKP